MLSLGSARLPVEIFIQTLSYSYSFIEEFNEGIENQHKGWLVLSAQRAIMFQRKLASGEKLLENLTFYYFLFIYLFISCSPNEISLSIPGGECQGHLQVTCLFTSNVILSIYYCYYHFNILKSR
jgi:hypothetical protein